MKNIHGVERFLQCIVCGKQIKRHESALVCSVCNESYIIAENKVFFTGVPNDYEGSGITSTRDHSTWSEWRRKNFEFYKTHLSTLANDISILDVGIGPGQFDELKERFAVSIGTDFRPFDPVDVVTDLTKPLPFKDESFDCIMISNTLEHLQNTEDVLSEMHRILKPGGLLIATIPFLMRIHQKPYDFNRYTNYKLAWLLERAGFVDVEVQGLSDPIDVYRTVQRHFFTYMISTRFTQNRMLNYWMRLCVRLLWRFQRVMLTLFSPLYNLAEKSDDFTEGYGITARKRGSL